VKNRPINVHQTLKYRTEKLSKALLGLAVVLFLCGVVGELFPNNRYPGWPFAVIGGGWAMWEFWRLHNPGKPLLVLSPQGIGLRIVGIKEVLVPWADVCGVGTVDVSAVHPTAPWRVKFPDVTVFEVSRRFYEENIHIDSSLLRGPGWVNTFIPKGDVVQVALHQEILPIKPDVLRAEIEARWRAFKDETRSESKARALSRLRDAWTGKMRAAWVLQLFLVAIAFAGFAFVFADRRGWIDAWHEHRRQQAFEESERRSAELHRQMKQFWEDQEKQNREREAREKEREKQQAEARARAAAERAALQAAKPVPPSQKNGHIESIQWLAVAPDGKTFLSAGVDRAIKLWDIGDANVLRDVGRHKGSARTVAVLPDGAHALSAGDDGEIVLRAIADGSTQHVFAATAHGGVRRLAVSADGRRAVSTHTDGAAVVWDIAGRSLLHVLAPSGIRTITISADGARAIGGGLDGQLRLWDIDGPSLSRTFGGHQGHIYAVAFTPDGARAVSGGFDRTLRLWDVTSGREVRSLVGHTDTVYALAVSGDGKRILSGSWDGTARLWDIETGKEVARFAPHDGPLNAVAFSADGDVLTGGADRAIRLWKPSGELVRLFPGNWGQVFQ
jgi:WD40 repeat protein